MPIYDKNPDEMIFMRILNLNPIDSNYWSNLFNYARLLLRDYPEWSYELEKKIYEFRRKLTETPTPNYENFLKLPQKRKADLMIPDFWLIITTIEGVDDLNAYFKDSKGNKITKHHLIGELEEIKSKIFEFLSFIKEKIRFTQIQP